MNGCGPLGNNYTLCGFLPRKESKNAGLGYLERKKKTGVRPGDFLGDLNEKTKKV